MSYENAPATRMLATHCVACGRALVDANSVEAGMGPDCRERHGYTQDADEVTRAQVNKHVYELALWRSNLKYGAVPQDAVEHLTAVRELGFKRLASVLETRLCDVVVKAVDERTIAVVAPYNETFIAEVRAFGRWDKERKAWLVGVNNKRRVFGIMKKVFAGALGVGPKGVFIIAAV